MVYLIPNQQTTFRFIKINNVSSGLHNITCGIPQAKGLLIHNNNFHKCFDPIELHHFADDSNLFYKTQEPTRSRN